MEMKHYGYPIVTVMVESPSIDVAGCWPALPAYRPPGDVEIPPGPRTDEE